MGAPLPPTREARDCKLPELSELLEEGVLVFDGHPLSLAVLLGQLDGRPHGHVEEGAVGDVEAVGQVGAEGAAVGEDEDGHLGALVLHAGHHLAQVRRYRHLTTNKAAFVF